MKKDFSNFCNLIKLSGPSIINKVIKIYNHFVHKIIIHFIIELIF